MCSNLKVHAHQRAQGYVFFGTLVMPRWAEPQRHTVVVVFVHLSLCVFVCVILQRAFLPDGKEFSNESGNAITA